MKKHYFLGFAFLTNSIWVSLGCGPLAIEKWAGKIYSYQVNALAFERKQDNEVIPYNDARAQGMFCMTNADFLSFLKVYVVPTAVKSPRGASQ